MTDMMQIFPENLNEITTMLASENLKRIDLGMLVQIRIGCPEVSYLHRIEIGKARNSKGDVFHPSLMEGRLNSWTFGEVRSRPSLPTVASLPLQR